MTTRIHDPFDFSDENFKKSSFSYDPPKIQTCVEVAAGEDRVTVRDSKNPDGPRLNFTHAEWRAFIRGVKAEEFDV